MSEVFIIAEAGVNHNGNIEIAKKLIEKAKEIGADAIKFQSFSADKFLSEDVKLDHVAGGSLKTFFKSVELSGDSHRLLKTHCDNVGIEFMSTPFDFEAADLLDELEVVHFKIASCDINNIPFLRHVAKKGKHMIVSTGTATMFEAASAYEVMFKHLMHDKITLLHCVSNYPTKLENVNLARMLKIKDVITEHVGFSDHTEGNIASLVAAMWGAEVIERHFTLDKNLPGPDHVLSSDPREFKELIQNIRDLKYFSKKWNVQDDEVLECEKDISPLIRRSVVAARDIEAGEILGADDITYKRPGTGLPPGMINEIVGRVVIRDMKENTQISLEDLR